MLAVHGYRITARAPGDRMSVFDAEETEAAPEPMPNEKGGQ
jgi:hypothetical protein